MRLISSIVLGLLLMGTAQARRPLAALLPAGFTDSTFAGTGVAAASISSGVAMQFAPDGRLFVCQQNGMLKVYSAAGAYLSTAIDLDVDSDGERGLLGIAFDPNFASNNHIYLYHTVASTPRNNRISRFTMSGNMVLGGSETALVNLDALSGATNHNGGAMHFGSDGKLYVAVGENADTSHAQSIANRHGKILRYNPDGTIPTDNPTSVAGIAGTLTGANRAIWAAGLRNPFTCHIEGNQLYVNDVGGGGWEEINRVATGARTVGFNFGWPNTEGGFTAGSFPNFTAPIHSYAHGGGSLQGYAITGGAYYPAGGAFPAMYHNRYFYADYVRSWIGHVDGATGAGPTDFLATSANSPVDLKVRNGILYYLNRGTGQVRQIQYTTPGTAPVVTGQPAGLTRSVGQTAVFTASATGTAPLSYQWTRNGVNVNNGVNGGTISGATTATLTITNVQTGNAGDYRLVVTNGIAPAATSNPATLTVTTNQPPTVTITSPVNNSMYNGGQAITYAATAADPEDGTLAAAAFSWSIVFHHAAHVHPFLTPPPGQMSGTFTTAAAGHLETDVWYRVTVTVTDSAGLTATSSVDILPNLVALTLQTNPPGLQVTYGGQPQTAPFVFQANVGGEVPIGAVTPQTLGANAYTFASWSDAGAAAHTITAPAGATTYTATFTQPPAPTITGLVLYDTTTDLPVPGFNPIADGAVLDLATLPAGITIVAVTNPPTGGSVRFAYDGNANYRTESTAPYSISGDTNGDLTPWTGHPTAGAHTLTATPFAGAGATGAAGTPVLITFSSVNPPPPPPPPPPAVPAGPEGDSGEGADEKCLSGLGAAAPGGAAPWLLALASLAFAYRGRRRRR